MDLLDGNLPRRQVLKTAVAVGGASALSACLDLGGSKPAPTGDPDAKPSRQHAWREYIRHDEHGNSQLAKHQTLLYINSYDKDWIGPLRSNRQVTYGGEELRVDALAKRIDTAERTVEDETHHIWTKKLPVSQLGDVKLVIAEKETDEDEEHPGKYLVTNKIDAPTEHVIRSYGMRWRIETFFEDSKQDLGLGDCELRTEEGASRHWHLLMAAYSLVGLDPDSSALGTVRSKASSLRANLEYSLKEAVYNLLSWVRDNDDRDVDDLMEEIDHLFVHSTADANVQS
jgi:hypothetical protein